MLAMMRRLVIVLVAVGFALGLSRTAAAQTSQKFPYLAAVTAEQTSVRAGADSRYYPFGSVGKNDLVQVVAQKAGWARVRAVGPAFEGFFGYLKLPKTEAARFRLDREGTQGLTLGSTSIFAPNLDEKAEPGRSWKPIAKLPAETTLTVLETYTGDLHVVYKVELPTSAEGWINMAHLRRASLEQIAAWENAMNEIKPAATPQPEAIAAQTPTPEPTTTQPPQQTELIAIAPVTTEDADQVTVAAEPPTDVTPTPTTPAPTLLDIPNQVLARDLTPFAPISQARNDEKDAPIAEQTQPAPPPTDESSAPIEVDISDLTLDDLEGAYARLLREPLETAEVVPLRRLYAAFAREHSGSAIVANHLGTRVEQLQIWGELQQKVVELNQLRDRARATRQQVDAVAAIHPHGKCHNRRTDGRQHEVMPALRVRLQPGELVRGAGLGQQRGKHQARPSLARGW
ncbi:MAG: SH3 domain-containing protein [Planctomycetes bacterium]|nr:SH3 domain-containing protein [Planctomycetota bacterium]